MFLIIQNIEMFRSFSKIQENQESGSPHLEFLPIPAVYKTSAAWLQFDSPFWE